MKEIKAIKMMTACSGVGTPEIAAARIEEEWINIEFENVGFSEIEPIAIKGYEALHGPDNKNLGDLLLMNPLNVPKHDCLVVGFPCQDVSRSGKMQGINKDSGTRSSLMWSILDILEYNEPEFILLENVSTITSKRFKEDLDAYKAAFAAKGYHISERIISSLSAGIPQIRKRWFMVMSKIKTFEFPEIDVEAPLLKDFLKENKPEDEELYFYDGKYGQLERIGNQLKIINATKQGYLMAEHGDVVDLSFYKSAVAGKSSRRGRVQKQRCHTLLTDPGELYFVEEDLKLRRLTAKDVTLLQGYSEADYYALKNAGLKNNQIKAKMGNAMTVHVIQHILEAAIDQKLI